MTTNEYNTIRNESEKLSFSFDEVRLFKYAIKLLSASKILNNNITVYYGQHKAVRNGMKKLGIYNKFHKYCNSDYGKQYYKEQRKMIKDDFDDFCLKLKDDINCFYGKFYIINFL